MTRKKLVLAQLVLLQVFCMSLTAFAAVTWQEEDGGWKCYEKDGTLVTDRWEKGRDGDLCYLDGEGRMAVDALVEYSDEYYYVDEDGARVRDCWISIPNDFDLWEEDVENIWYYFGAAGKAKRNGKKAIDGKTYLFDEEGRMLSGWQRQDGEDGLYYLGTGDEGWIHTGWQRLEPWEELDGDYKAEEWFYFRPGSGKAYRDAKKKINGEYYLFDENGVMESGWNLATPDDAVASESDARHAWFDEDTGKARKGWIQAYDPEDLDETGDLYWYYLDSKGIPFNSGGKDSGSERQVIMKNMRHEIWWEPYEGGRCAAKVIEGKTYLFNEKGQMVTGYLFLGNVPRDGGSRLGDINRTEVYYFYTRETDKEGQMMTGRQALYDDEEEEYGHAYFRNNGKAYRNAIIGGCLYSPTGIRKDARGDYEVLHVNEGSGLTYPGSSKLLVGDIIVDSSGKVKKSGTYTVKGVRYQVKNYIASEVEKNG